MRCSDFTEFITVQSCKMRNKNVCAESVKNAETSTDLCGNILQDAEISISAVYINMVFYYTHKNKNNNNNNLEQVSSKPRLSGVNEEEAVAEVVQRCVTDERNRDVNTKRK